jgi:hypothetical protein
MPGIWKSGLCRTAAGALLAAFALQAHHSIEAVYVRKPVNFRVTITKVEWLNPHARFWADVPDSGGKPVRWEFELGSPNKLIKGGWDRYTLKHGDQVTVTALPARDGSRQASVQAVIWPDGRKRSNFDLFDIP